MSKLLFIDCEMTGLYAPGAGLIQVAGIAGLWIYKKPNYAGGGNAPWSRP